MFPQFCTGEGHCININGTNVSQLVVRTPLVDFICATDAVSSGGGRQGGSPERAWGPGASPGTGTGGVSGSTTRRKHRGALLQTIREYIILPLAQRHEDCCAFLQFCQNDQAFVDNFLQLLSLFKAKGSGRDQHDVCGTVC